MEPDNFTFHIVPDKAVFYHKDLVELINSLKEKDKLELEKYSTELNEICNFVSKKYEGIGRREMKIVWGGVYNGLPDELNISNLLTHIDAGHRESLDLVEADGIKKGYLTYYGHNLNSKSRAYVYSISSKYVSILNQKAIKLCKF